LSCKAIVKLTPKLITLLVVASVTATTQIPAQMAHDSGTAATMEHKAATPSTTLTITGLDGTSKTISATEMMAMPQTTVTVTNGHTGKQETYGGVAVKDLLALVAPPKIVPVAGADATMKTKASPRMTVIVARGTDGFRVAITLCDTDPGCRSGQAIVADTLDGQPLTTEGAFKLILSADKMPGRWVRNLDALTVKNLGSM
jgi:hypothetical protein